MPPGWRKTVPGKVSIAELLGHASLEMSRRYTHLMPDAKRDAALSIDRLFTHGGHPESRK